MGVTSFAAQGVLGHNAVAMKATYTQSASRQNVNRMLLPNAVGATLGMALVLRGGSAVIWSQHQDAFPYIKGMLVVFLSWVVSPIASGDPIPAIPLSPRWRSFTLGRVP